MEDQIAKGSGKTSGDQLSELELTLTVLWNCARRWMNQRSRATSVGGLADLDVNLMHFLVYRNRPLRAIDMSFALSIDDMHLVTYALKKLVRMGMISSKKIGKEAFYSPLTKARQHYSDFLEDRKQFLEPAMQYLSPGQNDLEPLINLLRALTGIYEQAARTAASSKGSGD